MTFGLVKHNNNSISAITSAGQLAQGKMTLIKEQTASSSASISFVHGSSDVVFDSTYPIYLFKFINIHPATDNVQFMHNGSIDAGSNYNVTKTNTMFEGEHSEGGGSGTLNYITSHDIAQGTGNAKFTYNCGNDNDQSLSGQFFIFSPSSTTFVKHFLSVVSNSHNSDYEKNTYTSGYYNTTSDVDAIQFSYSSGNIDSGTIKLYGIKGS
tara:strand:- start:55 stop:684 length:630 start_codon:yes stop_codon:yes gene_type:complete